MQRIQRITGVRIVITAAFDDACSSGGQTVWVASFVFRLMSALQPRHQRASPPRRFSLRPRGIPLRQCSRVHGGMHLRVCNVQMYRKACFARGDFITGTTKIIEFYTTFLPSWDLDSACVAMKHCSRKER